MLRKFRALFFLIPATVLWAQQPSPSLTKPKAPAELEAKMPVSSVHVDGPYIALTFDDGPNQKLTPRLLDLLAEHHIHVTFFVVGENAALLKAPPQSPFETINRAHVAAAFALIVFVAQCQHFSQQILKAP